MGKSTLLRPMVGLLSTLIFLFGVTQVVITWANEDVDTQYSWGFLANGVPCVLTGVAGIVAAIFASETLSQISFIMNFLTTIEAFIVYIIYSRFLSKYLNQACGSSSFYNSYCQGIRLYLSTSTGVFWCWIILLLPFTTVISWKYVKHVFGKGGKGVEMNERK
eukprot:gene4983-6204_t